jgi:hypothetical protein
MKRRDLDSHELSHLKHCLRIAGERFAENAKMLRELKPTLHGPRLAAEFEHYVEQCEMLSVLLDEADTVTLEKEEDVDVAELAADEVRS